MFFSVACLLVPVLSRVVPNILLDANLHIGPNTSFLFILPQQHRVFVFDVYPCPILTNGHSRNWPTVKANLVNSRWDVIPMYPSTAQGLDLPTVSILYPTHLPYDPLDR